MKDQTSQRVPYMKQTYTVGEGDEKKTYTVR
jgi:hypothetical protein